jgi:hypothetical protein
MFVMVKCGVLFEVRTEVKYYLEELRLQRVKGTDFFIPLFQLDCDK